MSKQVVLLLWVLAGVALFSALGDQPVQRTQEARVLETARQMLGQPWPRWIIPHLNGELRLQKPPLAYWMAGAGFTLGGVTDAAGRAPFALCGWLLLPIFYSLVRQFFDPIRSLFACGMLLSTYLFFRHMRLAETDSPAALAVTLSIWAIWLASSLAPSPREIALYHLAAFGMAIAVMAKGGPIVFPLLFLVLASLAIGKNLVWRFIKSGAPVTLLILAVPWYAYITHVIGSSEFRHQMQNNLEGGDHGKPPWAYVPWLATALAPWIAFAVVALIGAIAWLIRSIRKNGDVSSFYRLRERFFAQPEANRLLVAWILAIAIPLSITGNKQLHYLLPLMPPLVLAAARIALDLADPRAERSGRILGGFLLALTALTLLAALLVGDHFLQKHQQLQNGDFFWLAIVTIACLSVVGFSFRRRAEALQILVLVSLGLVKQGVDNLPARLLGTQNPRDVAAWTLAQFDRTPKAFIGPNASLVLCYNMREAIPSLRNDAEMLAALKDQPDLVLIAEDKPGRTPPPPPRPFHAVSTRVVSEEQAFTFYRAE